jgi:hypothetical protein
MTGLNLLEDAGAKLSFGGGTWKAVASGSRHVASNAAPRFLPIRAFSTESVKSLMIDALNCNISLNQRT